jgi:hypothetical protein
MIFPLSSYSKDNTLKRQKQGKETPAGKRLSIDAGEIKK